VVALDKKKYLHFLICFSDIVLKHIGQPLPLPAAGILEQELDIRDQELKFGSTHFIKTDEGGCH
jgi:hypothetical protein